MIANTYSRKDIIFVKGEGCFLYDENGEKYLDFASGIAVCALGHSHKKFTEILKTQIDKILHISNLYRIKPQEELAKKIVKNSFADEVFFCNSGAEANEGAIKLARKFRKSISDKKTKILAFEDSFHGRTIGALSITGQEKYRKDFLPLLPDVEFAKFNDIDDVKNKLDNNFCAVFIELIQGEGGVNLAEKNFLMELREICNELKIMLVFDEVQTGIGRTGKLFCYEHYEIEPDVITLAKALGNGIPIGAVAGKKEFMKFFTPGSHASTFGGNFLASVAGCAVLDIIENENLLENVKKMSNYLIKELKSIDRINKIKGLGLLIGIEVEGISSFDLSQKLYERKILTVPAGDKVLRFLPPLIVTEKEIEILIKNLKEILRKDL